MLLSQGLQILTDRAEEDRALVFAAQSDTAAAGQLFDKYYPEIFRFICHSTVNHAVSEDLTSNVFFSAFRHLGLFRWRRIPFRAWLYRIATNELRMHYRRQKRMSAVDASYFSPQLPPQVSSTDAVAAELDDYRLLQRARDPEDHRGRGWGADATHAQVPLCSRQRQGRSSIPKATRTSSVHCL